MQSKFSGLNIADANKRNSGEFQLKPDSQHAQTGFNHNNDRPDMRQPDFDALAMALPV